MNRLKYILMILLLTLTTLVSAQTYVIDSVCVGADRTYRINGEKASTYEWHLTDTLSGIEIALGNPAGTPFEEIISIGDTVWGSEINIQWNDTGVFNLFTFHFSEFGCLGLRKS